MTRVLVGTRPSGRLHLGHYFSVILPALEQGADVLVAQYHAPNDDSLEFTKDLERYIPRQQMRFQSLHFNAGLFFRLLELTPSGLLHHMPQYKVKDKNALMFTYPVLMAHDVVGYDMVIVGEDQRPHAEFAADILPKLGLAVPQFQYDGGKVMDLRHPENKMSKSNPESCLFLDDADYERKIRRAVTDEAGRKNLEFIRSKFYGGKPPEQNADLKDQILAVLKPIIKDGG